MELDALLRHAVELGASDVHLKIGQPPVVRRDGTLERLEGWPPLDAEALDAALAVVGAPTPARVAAFHETGELDIAYQSAGLPRFRVNVFRQRGATSLAFRAIPVEDPIEILHPDEGCIVSQREVGLDTQSFEQALRRALRQDPDVLLIGELRDAETAQTALQAAESGHLVLSTMHTVDAAETIGRMVEFFPGVKQPMIRSIMAGVLLGVISQRLLTRVDGGRVAAVEVMVTNTRNADVIRENETGGIPEEIEEGTFFQMQTFTQALIDHVLAGNVDRETASNAATNKHDFLVEL